MENIQKYKDFVNEEGPIIPILMMNQNNMRRQQEEDDRRRRRRRQQEEDARKRKKEIYDAGEKKRKDTVDDPKAEALLNRLKSGIEASEIKFDINQDTDDEEWYNAFTYQNIKIEKISNPIMSKEKYTYILHEGELELKCSNDIKKKIFDLFEETYIEKRVGSDEFYDDEYMGESVDYDKMTRAELKRHFYNNFRATRDNIEKLVDETKDLDTRTQMSISYSMGVTAGALYCAIMKDKYGINVPI